MAKNRGVGDIVSCVKENLKCCCTLKGVSCTRDCRCVNCENFESVSKKVSINNKGCSCGKSKKREVAHVSCVDNPSRKSKCPCLRQNWYCAMVCCCYNCGNQINPPNNITNESNNEAPPVIKRKRSHPEPYKRSKGTSYLASNEFELTSGPWTKLETVLLQIVLEVLHSTKVDASPLNIHALYDFVVCFPLVKEMALQCSQKCLKSICGKLKHENSKSEVFNSLIYPD